MNDSPSSSTPMDLLSGRAALQDFWRSRLLSLPSGPSAQELVLCDARFEGWPLAEPAVLQALTEWLRPPGRRLRLVALDFDAVAREHRPPGPLAP